jgi:glutaredoxin
MGNIIGSINKKTVFEFAEDIHAHGRGWIDKKIGYEERLEAVAHAIVEKGKREKKVTVFSNKSCFNSKEAFKLLQDNGVEYQSYELCEMDKKMKTRFGNCMESEITYMAGEKNTPHIFIGEDNLGGL